MSLPTVAFATFARFIRSFVISGDSSHPKVRTIRMFPISEGFFISGLPWIRRFVISAVSLYPKIGNIRRFVPCGSSLHPKDTLYRGFQYSEIWNSFNRGLTVATCPVFKNTRGGYLAWVPERRLIYQVDIHSGCQTSGERSARVARQRLLSHH